ncbi:MAG: hypothetical protein C4547_07495 [Phycisphaerales bacterium]|nr:MAG: hypothetical protein C4547_07495 [Phycisphaerales bacterium]
MTYTFARWADGRLPRCAAITIALALGTSAARAQNYSVTDLGSLGGAASLGFGLNNLGRVVGASDVETFALHGFFWDGGMTEIAPLPDDRECHAFDVNDDGRTVATSFNLGALTTHGLSWQNGQTTDLGDIAPHGVNSAGVIVGYLSQMEGDLWVDRAARWDQGVITELDSLGGAFCYAAAIADSGRVVGWSYTGGDQIIRATLWQDDVPRDLGTLGGTDSQAYDLNEDGQVVGYSDTADGEPHAFLYVLAQNGNVLERRDLGTLEDGYSYAYGINAAGDVVGTADGVAVMWRDGQIADLNSVLPPESGWRLDVAWAINDGGAIVGTGIHKGQKRAYLLQPIGGVNCDAINKLAAKCKRGQGHVTAKVKSTLEQGTSLTLLLDNADARVVAVNAKGKAKATWTNVPPGRHEVCIQECPQLCDAAKCRP